MIPVFLALFYVSDETISLHNKHLFSALLFAFAAVTDWLDGYLARRLNQGSAFGAFLDPVADKLMVAAALILLVSLGRSMRSLPLSSSDAKSLSPPCANGWPSLERQKHCGVNAGQGQNHIPDDRHSVPVVSGTAVRFAHQSGGLISDLRRCFADFVVNGLLPDAGDAADHAKISRVKLIFPRRSV